MRQQKELCWMASSLSSEFGCSGAMYHRAKAAFSLLEVVVALAMLALIAIPAVGLATMAVNRSREQMTVGNASELKSRIDTALRAYNTGAVFSSDFVPNDSDLSFLASEDLQYIELESGTLDTENDQYYRVLVKEPEGYVYNDNDAYRVVLYEVVWPNNDPNVDQNQLFFTSVFRK